MSVKFGDDSTKVVPFDGDDNANDDDSGSGKGEEKGSEASDDDLAAFEKEEEEVESSTKMAKKRQKTRETEIEEVLADFAGKPKATVVTKKKKKKATCISTILRIFGCATVDLFDAVLEGESSSTLKALQRLSKKPKTKPLINQWDQWGRTALALAIKEEREDLADLILSLEGNPDKMDNHKKNPKLTRNTPMHMAVQAGLLNTVTKLKWREANLNSRDATGCTPLMLACMLGDAELVEILLENGAEPDMTDKSGWTPLIYCCYGGSLECAEMILDTGVSHKEVDKKGYMAIHWAQYMRKKTGELKFGEVEAHLETFKPSLRIGGSAKSKYAPDD